MTSEATHDNTDDNRDWDRDLEVLRVHGFEPILPWPRLTRRIVAVPAIPTGRSVDQRCLEHHTLIAAIRQQPDHISNTAHIPSVHRPGPGPTHLFCGSLHETTQLSSFFCPHASVKFIELPDCLHCWFNDVQIPLAH